jgi:hypothetical protein
MQGSLPFRRAPQLAFARFPKLLVSVWYLDFFLFCLFFALNLQEQCLRRYAIAAPTNVNHAL